MKFERKSGLLLHVSSLPAAYGIGDFGKEAYRFIDQLVENGFKIWQILPLGPNGPGNSPYQAYSAYAGDSLYISPEKLNEWGLLSDTTLKNKPIFNKRVVDFDKVTKWKLIVFEEAWTCFNTINDSGLKNEFSAFLDEHNWWLADYALYASLKQKFTNVPWNNWDEDLASRRPATIDFYTHLLSKEILFEKFVQFLFFKQWFQLKKYANQKGIQLFGDIPLYVSHDSADVWGNQELFLLDENGLPTKVGGVPPDYFSEDGQLWGNPVFNWEQLSKTDYHWWMARMYFNFHMFNLVRIDHFRGLESFWAIPSDAETAKIGEWLPAKGYEMLAILRDRMGELPIIAEDLGIITEEVQQLRDDFNLPGMKVIQFAFASDYKNEHLPHNFRTRNVVYTGTHDNDTLIGWWKTLSTLEKKMAMKFISYKKGTPAKGLVEIAWASTAELAIVPMQDVLALDSSGRMNIPGTAEGNWRWRYDKKQLKNEHFQYFKELNIIYNR